MWVVGLKYNAVRPFSLRADIPRLGLYGNLIDLPNKLIFNTAIDQMTENGAPVYGGCNKYRGEATFTKSFNTCYFQNKTLVKVPGGGINNSNYKCVESGEFFRVMKFEKLR